MGLIGYPETSITNNLRRVAFHKSEDLIYMASKVDAHFSAQGTAVNLEVHYHSHKSQPLDSSLSQLNPSQSFNPYISKVSFKVVLRISEAVSFFKGKGLKFCVSCSPLPNFAARHARDYRPVNIDVLKNVSKYHRCILEQSFDSESENCNRRLGHVTLRR